MKYCGIELKGDEARVIGVQTKGDSYTVIPFAIDKFKIKDPSSQQDMQSLQNPRAYDRIGILAKP